MTKGFNDLPTSRMEITEPDAEGLTTVLGRIGHSLGEALADLIDNSIDASARTVLVRFERDRDRIRRVVVADDGSGMTESVLAEIMRFGVRKERHDSDLGKYGIGLKAASLSRCNSFSVLSRTGENLGGRRWTRASIKLDWRVEVIREEAVRSYFSQDWGPVNCQRHGTLVVWDDVRRETRASSDFEAYLDRMLLQLDVELGMKFHRFIERGDLSLFLQVNEVGRQETGVLREVVPHNPFGYPKSGRKGFPVDFKVEIDDYPTVEVKAHIWPALSKSPNYRLGGGAVVKRQGFYFYRNDRLIEPGGWHGLQMEEPHSSLARVAVELPPALDAAFHLTVQKHGFEPPRAFFEGLAEARAGTTTFRDYMEAAKEAYRNAPKQSARLAVPGKGIPAGVAREIRECLEEEHEGMSQPIAFKWQRLDDDEVFAVERDDHQVLINSLYRSELGGSIGGALVSKVLLFFLSQDALQSRRLSRKLSDRLDEINLALLAAIDSL